MREKERFSSKTLFRLLCAGWARMFCVVCFVVLASRYKLLGFYSHMSVSRTHTRDTCRRCNFNQYAPRATEQPTFERFVVDIWQFRIYENWNQRFYVRNQTQLKYAHGWKGGFCMKFSFLKGIGACFHLGVLNFSATFANFFSTRKCFHLKEKFDENAFDSTWHDKFKPFKLKHEPHIFFFYDFKLTWIKWYWNVVKSFEMWNFKHNFKCSVWWNHVWLNTHPLLLATLDFMLFPWLWTKIVAFLNTEIENLFKSHNLNERQTKN